MAVDSNDNHPFFSSLLEQGFINKIPMPADFVKEHKKLLAKTCLLKTDEGLFWEAKIAREKPNNYFICEGDWARFVLHHKLELGDMLIFFLVDKSTFKVLPYSKKPRSKVRHLEELSSSDEEEAAGEWEEEAEVENVEEKEDEEQETGIGPSRRSKKVKTEPRESSAHGARSNESLDHDSIEILYGPPRSNRGKTKSSDTVENPLRQSSKIKRREGGEEHDASLDMHIKRMEIEKLLEGVDSPSFTTSGCGSCKMHRQQSSTFYDVRRTVMEKAKAYQNAKANFKSKNPFFISFLHPSNISRHLHMNLPFARKCIPENCSNIVLRVEGRGSWPVTYTLRPERAKISNGWKEFVCDNQLKPGDVCVFEVIKGTQIFMDVTIFHATGSKSMQETEQPDCS